MPIIRSADRPIVVPKKIFYLENNLSFGAIGLYCTLIYLGDNVPLAQVKEYDHCMNSFLNELIEAGFIKKTVEGYDVIS